MGRRNPDFAGFPSCSVCQNTSEGCLLPRSIRVGANVAHNALVEVDFFHFSDSDTIVSGTKHGLVA